MPTNEAKQNPKNQNGCSEFKIFCPCLMELALSNSIFFLYNFRTNQQQQQQKSQSSHDIESWMHFASMYGGVVTLHALHPYSYLMEKKIVSRWHAI